jgi:hypothetical protein
MATAPSRRTAMIVVPCHPIGSGTAPVGNNVGEKGTMRREMARRALRRKMGAMTPKQGGVGAPDLVCH